MTNKQPYPSKLWLAYAGLTMAVFFWSINTVLARGMVFTIKPMALSFYRWLFAFLFILPFSIHQVKKDWPVIRQNYAFLFVLAVFSVGMYNSIIYLGAQFTTATNISLVISTMPGMTLLLAWLINKERTNRVQIIGVLISLCGLMAIVSQGSVSVLRHLTFNPGDLLIILAILSWALYSVLLKKRQMNISPLAFLTVLIAVGTICIFPFYFWEYTIYKGFEINLSHFILFVFLGIFPSVLSYVCWNFGVKTAGSSTAAVFMYLIPVFTSILAFFFLGEHLYGYHFWGGGLILIGLIMSSRQ